MTRVKGRLLAEKPHDEAALCRLLATTFGSGNPGVKGGIDMKERQSGTLFTVNVTDCDYHADLVEAALWKASRMTPVAEAEFRFQNGWSFWRWIFSHNLWLCQEGHVIFEKEGGR